MSLNNTLKALCDPTRRAILNYLKEDSLTAGDIANKFNITSATISHHLLVLKNADLIKERKDKNFIYYSLNTSVLEEVLLWVNDLKGEQNNEKEK